MSLLLLLVPGALALSPSRAGDFTVTEFQADTSVVPQYFGEWFEVRNNSFANLDLQGVTFTCASGSFTVERSLVVAAGDYAVFAVSSDSAINGGVTGVDYVYPFASFNLSRSADAIGMDLGTLVLDEVVWTSSWPTSPDESHQASRNALAIEWANDLAVNWCPSTTFIAGSGMRGTPGAQNRYCSEDPGIDSDGDGWAETAGDCDDTDATVSPGEVDDSVGDRARRDDDCDGVRDDGDTDDDLDGFTEVEGDCNDDAPGSYPGAAEVVDGADNDCDGCIDDLDADGDGWTACEEPYDRNGDGDTDDAGDVGADCNDNNPRINPEAPDVPYDGTDQDCYGGDECDNDDDGWPATECGGSDCDDGNPRVNPGTAEDITDGVDNDCNGEVDVPDRDGDGFAVNDGDCMDIPEDEDPERGALSAAVFPGAVEVCGDLLDNDCDGFIDNLPDCANPAAAATVRGGGLCGVAHAGPGAGALALVGLGVALGRRRRRDHPTGGAR